MQKILVVWGGLSGMFVEEEEDIKKSMGKRVTFYEYLGKHSEITTILNDNNIKEVTDDQEFIQSAIKFNIIPNGVNPLDILRDEGEL